jgi:hypothetical protein
MANGEWGMGNGEWGMDGSVRHEVFLWFVLLSGILSDSLTVAARFRRAWSLGDVSE